MNESEKTSSDVGLIFKRAYLYLNRKWRQLGRLLPKIWIRIILTLSRGPRLWRDVADLKRHVLEFERVDVVRKDGFVLILDEDDYFYQHDIAENDKRLGNEALVGAAAVRNRTAIRTPTQFLSTWTAPHQSDLPLLAHLLDIFEDVNVFDVGCYYGLTSLQYARFLDSFGVHPKVFAFDPGKAGRLAPLNFVNNGYADIQFNECAVSDVDGYVLMYLEHGHGENNRVINRRSAPFSRSWPVRSVTLDRFLDEHDVAGDVFLKIDTQGAEFEVLNGALRTRQERCVAGVLEFSPWSLKSRIDPVDFLKSLIDEFIVIHIGVLRDQLRLLDPQGCAEYVAELRSSPKNYTDLLFFPPSLPGVERLRTIYGI